MSIYLRNGIWHLYIRHRGRRIRRTTGTSDEEAAERIHDELKAELWKQKPGYRFDDALLAWIKEKPRSHKDLNAVRFIREHFPDRPLIDVTPEAVEEALGARSAGAYNRYMVVVRAALNIAKRKRWLESVPVFTRKKEVPPERKSLTQEEWLTLRAELPEHLQDMADFSIATGLRWDNVALLEWEQVSMDRRQAMIPGWKSKTGKPIPVPLSTAALAVLERVRGVDRVFCFTYQGRPIISGKGAWKKAIARAGLDGFVWHELRHTWASWHAMAGTPMEVLQDLGGWQSPQMLDRYRHLTPEYLAKFAGNAALSTKVSTKKRK